MEKISITQFLEIIYSKKPLENKLNTNEKVLLKLHKVEFSKKEKKIVANFMFGTDLLSVTLPESKFIKFSFNINTIPENIEQNEILINNKSLTATYAHISFSFNTLGHHFEFDPVSWKTQEKRMSYEVRIKRK